MADDKRSQADVDNSRLEEIALKLFGQSVNGLQPRQFEKALQHCFAAAGSFIKFAEDVRNGVVPKAQAKPKLVPCHAPKLSKFHPINLISQRHGSVEKVRRAFEIVDKIDLTNPDAQVSIDMSEAGIGMTWGRPEVSLAKRIFPQIVNN